MDNPRIKKELIDGEVSLGIEFGSTRIKAVLIGSDFKPLAVGKHDWENRLENGYWTYRLEEILKGLQGCYRNLKDEVENIYGVTLTDIKTIGISGMMHGYMVFDREDELIVPFRTWRNTSTGVAADKLTHEFDFNIPQRWSIAHLYQAALNREEHISRISYITTLAGYIHWKLTKEKVVGIGEASGMFPVDTTTKNYDQKMIEKFDKLIDKEEYPWKIKEILPKILLAGQRAGALTKEGALLLDPQGNLNSGAVFCPPEGDAGTGMIATNSIKKGTGNISAGTSVFAMLVMEKSLSSLYSEIDIVTTPNGNPVAMVHSNNCTSDLNAWVNLFNEVLQSFSFEIDTDLLYNTLYKMALKGDSDCGGLMSYNYLSGEHITGMDEGRPLFIRKPESRLNLSNFMRTHLFSALGALKTGINILIEREGIKIDSIFGHGGYFKIKEVGPKIMAAALNTRINTFDSSDEGGAWGIALLAAFTSWDKKGTLEEFLEESVFSDIKTHTFYPEKEDVKGFEKFYESYVKGLPIEKAATKHF